MTTRRDLLRYGVPILLTGCGGGGAPSPAPSPAPAPAPVPTPVPGPPLWSGYAGSAQHQAISGVATQALARVLWTTPVDLAPPYRAGGELLIHYGSPAITATGTVLLPVRTGSGNGVRLEARVGTTGALLWQQDSAYVLPTSSWTPSCSVAVDANNRVYFPESGGRLLRRDAADSATGTLVRLCFYGDAVYAADAAGLDAAVQVCTPLTVGADGSVYFGFMATPTNSANVRSGFVRIAADGSGTWVGATAVAAPIGAFDKPAMNAAPALSADGLTLYVAVNTQPDGTGLQNGAILALDAATLALKQGRTLREPSAGALAYVTDSSTASPLVGPDGDVYYGVLQNVRNDHNGRGWLLHFDAGLTMDKTPGSFGWDDTPSVVAASLVSSYTGSSSYLLLSKYNNYYGAGTGDGQNKMAVLDPNAAQPDFITPGVQVMKEVITVLGPTPDPTTPGGVHEWCVNTAAVDPATASVLMNSEDGVLYGWDLRANRLSESLRLNAGLGQAYTPTVVGRGGIVYAINNATLNAAGS
ncbi:MAG: hypothetical protein JO006_10510 [Paucibacter sp.]|nr:hypothetical protein [Roseateles sp.]